MAGDLSDFRDTDPLLEAHRGIGTASARKTFGNVIISVLGAGILGLPFAFKVSGWAVTSAAITFCGCVSYYSMMLLIKCRIRLANQEQYQISALGDFGHYTYGSIGREVVDITQMISQIGCCVSYLLFIGQNLSSIFIGRTQSCVFIFCLLPFQVFLAWVRSLAALAPFSIFADVCNVLAMAIVFKDDIDGSLRFDKVKPYTNLSGTFFGVGVALYCFEGMAMTLSLEASMKKPHKFGKVLGLAFGLIGLLYISFGFAGYLAYGEQTHDIITLNLPNEWTTVAVKISLCIALFFTFPVMMHPVYDIFERKLGMTDWYQKSVSKSPKLRELLSRSLRGLVVLIIGFVAVLVPGFGVFISLVGSTVCALLALVLPAIFHIHIFKDDLGLLEKLVDMFLIVCGIAFAIYGTYDSFVDIFGSYWQ
ncbi:hypothetical protein O6H91_09G006800 [Diphasiastrum complanatum]|uniref:Uncharacterized protein n=1 Tax=Diphasiastrum complanatum TaxID=34168 RepID=A0ACC2CL20_DIPCM|nr:hypothetical protein O6H91_09G006800 [Diphasiastrum complanatum]